MQLDNRLHRYIFTTLGVFFLLLCWQILSITMPDIVLASPVETARALARMMGTGIFWQHFRVTGSRVFTGVFIGGLAGFVIGIFGGLNKSVKYMLEPFRWTLMSTPAVVIVVMAMLWFGMGSTMVVFITAIFLAPFVYVNVVKGLEMVDETVIEMAQIYNFPFSLKLKHVYVPAIAGHLASSLMVIVGTGVRIVILAEVLGTTEGIGYALSLSRTNLDIPALFAWILICIALVGIIEYVILKPLQDYVLKWKKPTR
ncbi:MAG: ABC transporter permease subunit [Candidatus Latescibacteria bacterium]|nr:ABC transporter permease subunit [Candidatus Latescibacterota bacterium]